MIVYIQEIYYIDNIMPGPKKFLTPKQTKFAELIVYGIEGSPITKSEAARLAGYSDFASEGSKLTNPKYFPLVCAYISNLQDEVRQKYGITFEGHLEELGKIRDRGKKDNKNLAAAATTEIARGKAAGFYIDQKIIRHGNIDDMNLDQLYARMKNIKERNEKIMEAKKLLTEDSEKIDKSTKSLPSPQQKNDQD
jgi:phage terminase small subunit|tara:strand:+ start:421 stop:1002 length:582 start_codon:yes stop_codon:yes gene_type:complete